MTASWVLLISIFVLIVICIVLLCIKKIRDNRIVLYIVIPLLIGIVLLLGQWCFRYNFEKQSLTLHLHRLPFQLQLCMWNQHLRNVHLKRLTIR